MPTQNDMKQIPLKKECACGADKRIDDLWKRFHLLAMSVDDATRYRYRVALGKQKKAGTL